MKQRILLAVALSSLIAGTAFAQKKSGRAEVKKESRVANKAGQEIRVDRLVKDLNYGKESSVTKALNKNGIVSGNEVVNLYNETSALTKKSGNLEKFDLNSIRSLATRGADPIARLAITQVAEAQVLLKAVEKGLITGEAAQSVETLAVVVLNSAGNYARTSRFTSTLNSTVFAEAKAAEQSSLIVSLFGKPGYSPAEIAKTWKANEVNQLAELNSNFTQGKRILEYSQAHFESTYAEAIKAVLGRTEIGSHKLKTSEIERIIIKHLELNGKLRTGFYEELRDCA